MTTETRSGVDLGNGADASVNVMIPTRSGDELRDALMRAVGWDKLPESQQLLATKIAQRYDLDPMLRHIVMIDGKPYITRDGLLHVAHKSGRFDGIEVTTPENDGKFWRATATVYRKDFARPFVYPGRYPAVGGNQRYSEEMAIKVAEVMTLRRAFDVGAPVLEERWADDDAEEQPAVAHVEGQSVIDKIAARAASLPQAEAATQSATPPVQDVAPTQEEATPPRPLDEQTYQTADGEVVASDEIDEPAVNASVVEVVKSAIASLDAEEIVASAPDAMSDLVATAERDGDQAFGPTVEGASLPSLEDFKRWSVDYKIPKQLIVESARELYPAGGAFDTLSPAQLARIINLVEDKRRARAQAYEPEVVQPSNGDPAPTAVAQCGVKSPLSDSTCTLDPGHPGAHRAGLRESW